MEKIAIVGDLHLSRKAENPIIKKHIREGQRKFFDVLAKDLKKENVKTLFLTGDIHDTRTMIDVEALVYTKRLLREGLKDFDIRIVLGNHDLYYEDSYEISALELFEDIPNVTVYRNKVVKEKILGKQWYIIPWLLEKNEEDFTKFLTETLGNKKKEEKDNTIIFGHFDMFGINMEGKSISTFGIDPNMFLDAAKLTISGHYHGKSNKVSGDNSLFYVGSPYPMTFANSGQQHGYWLLDESGKMDFRENSVSPTFEDVWDTDDLDNLGDMSNSFMRLYMSNDRTMEELFEIRSKAEKSNPLMIKKIPYSGEKDTEEEKTESVKEANQILAMDTIKLSEVYMEQKGVLPNLQTYPDCEPKTVILDKIKSYKKTLNL